MTGLADAQAAGTRALSDTGNDSPWTSGPSSAHGREPASRPMQRRTQPEQQAALSTWLCRGLLSSARPVTLRLLPCQWPHLCHYGEDNHPFAKLLRWGWDLSHIFLSCSGSTKANSLSRGCPVRKMNAASLIPSPRSLSRMAAARLKHFED